MLFREEVMRMAYGIFPYLQNLVVVFRNRSAYIRQIIAQVIVYISVVGKFRLMQYTFTDKAVAFQYLLRPLVVRITVGGDKAELKFVETIIKHSLYRFRHISFSPVRLVEPVSQHTYLRVFPLRVGDDADGADELSGVFQCYSPDILLTDKHVLENFARFFYRFMGSPSGIIAQIRILATSEECFCIIFPKRPDE